VVVVNTGAPVAMPWRDEVAAVLPARSPGQEFGSALADILFGRVEPGGRLPTTWPAAVQVYLSYQLVNGTDRSLGSWV
jgi:beta-glucosidase